MQYYTFHDFYFDCLVREWLQNHVQFSMFLANAQFQTTLQGVFSKATNFKTNDIPHEC